MTITPNAPLADLTWWKIGGPADFFCEPSSLEELGDAMAWAEQQGHAITVLSGGSNVLISDAGVQGLVVSMRALKSLEVHTEAGFLKMVGLAGCPKAEPLKHFLREKLAPAVFLCGLPGDLGGGVVMNAGVGDAITPREFVEIVEFVEVMRLAGGRPVIIRLRAEDLQWSYRHCSGWEPGIIVRVGLRWPLGADADVPQRVREATRRRLERQPLQEPSCGSVFKNPVGAKAGALIEQAGLKGLRLGGAQVSEKHANFIVNRGGASAADVDKLIKTVQAEVFRKAGIKLECEVRYLGRWPKS